MIYTSKQADIKTCIVEELDHERNLIGRFGDNGTYYYTDVNDAIDDIMECLDSADDVAFYVIVDAQTQEVIKEYQRENHGFLEF